MPRLTRFFSARFLLAGALLLTAACSGGDKNTDGGGSDGASRALFQPAGVVGPDSFAPTFAVASYSVDPSTLTSGDVSGSAPGLYAGRTYGGTGANICDVEAMIAFLTYYEDRGRAWAAIQGIDHSELESYLRGLTPVFALQNLNVQMFGFKNGASYGYDAVIAAGTAILVDDEGMPRARCACGNPLLGPSEDAPEGTDNPPTSVPEDGNPQTQDSVPDESIPQDSVPVDSVPADSVPDDSVPADSTPNDSVPEQPGTDPECPDWNTDPVRYTDPSGMVWEYDRRTDTWFSTSDADLFKYPTNDLPGYLELCDQPGQRQPGGDCPEPFRGSWTDYYASNGDVWRWEFTSVDTGYWVNQDGETIDFLVDIPGYVEDCGDPFDTHQPECPEPINGIGGMDWTPYHASNGDLWVYDARGDLWKSQDTGSTVAGYDPSAIPGYVEDCGEPPADENPCPPEQPSVGDSWTDSETGETWIYELGRDPETGVTILIWINTTTGEERSSSDLYQDECGEPITPKTVCPPTKAVIGTVWIDGTGEEWIFAAGSGGADGWDQVSTPEIENLTYAELPDKPSGCPEPRRPLDCPPITDIPEGYVWFGHDGNVYRYSSADGGWVNESDASGQVVAYTVILPGYRKYCLPPCPPLNVLETDAHAVWIDPSTGHLWLKTTTASEWTNTVTGETLATTLDLPFYTEDCLPPCDPEAEGGTTYVINDEGIPETNEAFDDQYGDTADTAVTVVADASGINPQQIIEQRLEAVTAIGDDCNPNGCVEPNTEPALGHSFRDAYGVLWRYVGNGEWQAENGDFVTDVLDIPGYVDACLPPEVPVDRECPPEFKGSEYTDSNNLVWTWTGSHSTPEESDHGQYWYYRYEDGTSEYRYTYQLEPFFDDCPRPEGVETQSSDVFVSLRTPKRACTGEQVPVLMTAWNAEGAVREGELFLDGSEIDSFESEPGFFNGFFTVDAPGRFSLKGVATDSDGNEGSAAIDVTVVDCGDGTIQGDPSSPDASTPVDSTPDDSVPTEPAPSGDNTPPVVTVTATPECIEIESGQQKTYSVEVTASDSDGDTMTVLLNDGLLGQWTITGSGTQSKVFTANDRNRANTLSFTATADDGQVVTTSNTASVRVQYPGGCQPTQSTTANTAPTVTIATKPAQTIPVCKSGTGSSVPVTFSINVSDPQGDTSTVTLASYNETTRLGTTARNVGSVTAAGIVTATETVTAAQIGHTIEYIARADDGTLVGIARVKITVVERTTGCTAENKAPTVVLTNKTWPGCINQKDGSPVTFTIGDTAGTKLSIVIKIAGKVVQEVTRTIPLGSTSTNIDYTFTANQAGQSVSVEVVDDKGASAQPLTTTLTKELCPG